ncbi:MAG: PIN domain nuclease [Deltaproteobacteria bacterium]|nr:PIN domain nuclease [Deltaproteobacteria bacterium]
MIVVDTSAWGAFFNGDPSPVARRLVLALETGEPLATIPIIVAETLQGFRTETGFRSALSLLTRLPLLEPSLGTHVQAARLYRSLRKKGVTVRGTVDCLIASVCIETGAALLTLDRDFLRIAEHTALDIVP